MFGCHIKKASYPTINTYGSRGERRAPVSVAGHTSNICEPGVSKETERGQREREEGRSNHPRKALTEHIGAEIQEAGRTLTKGSMESQGGRHSEEAVRPER